MEGAFAMKAISCLSESIIDDKRIFGGSEESPLLVCLYPYNTLIPTILKRINKNRDKGKRF